MRFFMVGLPDSAVKESEQRVEASLKLSGYRMPRQKVVVNLAPADIRKEGSAYDLPIALCVLQASEQITVVRSLEDYVIMGELSLDGKLRPIKGVLPIAIEARKRGYKGFILPAENAEEGIAMFLGVHDEAVEILEGNHGLGRGHIDPAPLAAQVAAIDDGDVEKRRKYFSFFQLALEALHGEHALESEVIGKLPEEPCIHGAHHAIGEGRQHRSIYPNHPGLARAVGHPGRSGSVPGAA